MSALGILAWFVLLGAAFFFFIVRPQRRQMAAHRALIQAVRVGDEVVTSSGILGTIRALADDTVQLEIADGVVVTLARGAISQRVAPEVETGIESGEAP